MVPGLSTTNGSNENRNYFILELIAFMYKVQKLYITINS